MEILWHSDEIVFSPGNGGQGQMIVIQWLFDIVQAIEFISWMIACKWNSMDDENEINESSMTNLNCNTALKVKTDLSEQYFQEVWQ